MAKQTILQTPQLLIQKVAQEKGITEAQFIGGLIAAGKIKTQITAKRLWDGDPNTSVVNLFYCAEVLDVAPSKLLPG